MPMPNSFAIALRRLVLLLGMIAIAVTTPSTAAADTPPGKKKSVATSTSRSKARVAAAPRNRTARAKVTRSRSTRLASRRASGRSSRRSRRVLGPLVPVVAQASFASDSAETLRDSIVSVARQQIGTPYIWGAETPGRAFDCSGLVKYVMSWLNVRLPRTANEQAYTGISVGKELDRMKPGDLLTFGTKRRITHIAIYSGNGKYVHASRPGVGVVESRLDTRASRFRGAVRLVADADTGATRSLLLP